LAGTAAAEGNWRLDKENQCVAKPRAIREKDLNFVDALLAGGLVDAT
jgi:hypothetical protein